VYEGSNERKAKEKYRGMKGSRETTVDITVYSERHNGTTV